MEKRGLLRSYDVKGSVTDRILSKTPTSYSLKTEYLMLHGKLRKTEVIDKITVINQLTLRQKDYPGGSDLITGAPLEVQRKSDLKHEKHSSHCC